MVSAVPLRPSSQLAMHITARLMHVSYSRISRPHHRCLILRRICTIQSLWQESIPYLTGVIRVPACRRGHFAQTAQYLPNLHELVSLMDQRRHFLPATNTLPRCPYFCGSRAFEKMASSRMSCDATSHVFRKPQSNSRATSEQSDMEWM